MKGSRLRRVLRMARRLFNVLAAIALLLCAAALVLRYRSIDRTDVFVLSLPRGKALFVRSNAGLWFEFTLVTHGWPGGRGGAWTMPAGPAIGWGDLGPQAFWYGVTHVRLHPWHSGYRWQLIWGELSLMCDPATGLPNYDRTGPHAPRIEAYRQPSPSPYWSPMTAWQLSAPHGDVAATAAFLPAAWALAWLVRRVRGVLRDRALRMGRCRACGYDLRATPGRCPECGTVAAESAS